MSGILYNCYAISTAFTGLFIPITVPSTILKNIDYEENGSTEWLRTSILFQLYITVFSFLCILAIQVAVGTMYGADIKRSVHKVMFMKNPSLLMVDVLLFYLTISLMTILTEEQQWKIVGPLLICRCFQTFLTTMMANLVNYDIAATSFVYHYHLVCFVSSIFIPIMIKNEIEKFGAIQTYGVTSLRFLLSFYKNTSKAVLLSAIWLILWNDEALSDVVIFHRRSRLRTFAVEAIYLPASLFWFTFMVGLICFRLPDVWPILTMLQFMHSCGLWFIREIVDYKLKRLDPMSPVFHDLQAQDNELAAEMDAALGDLERELNDLAAHLENIRSQRRQQTNGGQRNQNQQLVGSPSDVQNGTIRTIPTQNTVQHGHASTSQYAVRFGQALEQPNDMIASTENRAQLQHMEDNVRSSLVRGMEEEEKFQKELKTAEDEFWIWIESEYPDVFQEWQRTQNDRKAKIKQREDKRRKDFERIMGMMISPNAETNSGDDLEDAEYISEDDI